MIVAIVILLSGWYLESYMHKAAISRAKQHKHTFYEYVVTHNLGTLTLIDTGTGIDPMAYILQLKSPLADNQREAFAKNMAHLYAQYDQGSTLTIEYVNPTTHKISVIAESQWTDDTGKLQLTVTFSDGHITQLNEHVNW